jgi:uncharacterized protein YjlB
MYILCVMFMARLCGLLLAGLCVRLQYLHIYDDEFVESGIARLVTVLRRVGCVFVLQLWSFAIINVHHFHVHIHHV